ncbi:MAG: HD domain-containing phosphohydrolase [Candidatus Omnitrophota bacterium]|nr:HD domain-containing protein [Candidatus Omnitrophota bacterium]
MENERLFTTLKNNWQGRKEIRAFSRYIKEPEWIFIPASAVMSYGMLKKTKLEEHLKRSSGGKGDVRREIYKVLSVIKHTRDKRALRLFCYGKACHGAAYPLISGQSIFGFILMCGFKNKLPEDLGSIFTALTDAVIREVRKEFELEEVNENIRPRAVALSTVHTLHRLMTSTLDINELIPRIARLSMQVIRANRCSIKLVDKKRKVLLPKATIDLREKKTKLKKVRIGKYAPGRAVKKGIPVRSKNYLAVPMIDEDVVGVITLYDKFEGKEFTQADQEIMKTLSEQAAIGIKNAQLYKEQADITLSSIKCIAGLLQNRSHGAHRAEASFVKLISIIAPKFNMNERETQMLQYAAMLHDAGQIGVPEKVLMKKGGLTGREYDIIKKHPMTGAEILSKFKPLKPIVPIILYHHERFDGKGYPKGLKGKDIPLAARMLAVISVFEVMITEKPYRKARPVDTAIKELRNGAGKQFDPSIVEALCEAVHRKDVRKLLDKELGVA